MDWYHEALMHPGQARMEECTLKYFTWPGCTKDIARFTKSCSVCQKCKNTNKGRTRQIPLKDNIKIEPWNVLSVDLVGPWKTKIKKGNKKLEIEIWALTMMDDATGWIEIIPMKNKKVRKLPIWWTRNGFVVTQDLWYVSTTMVKNSKEMNFRNCYSHAE